VLRINVGISTKEREIQMPKTVEEQIRADIGEMLQYLVAVRNEVERLHHEVDSLKLTLAHANIPLHKTRAHVFHGTDRFTKGPKGTR
jgi:hypothetical protein